MAAKVWPCGWYAHHVCPVFPDGQRGPRVRDRETWFLKTLSLEAKD